MYMYKALFYVKTRLCRAGGGGGGGRDNSYYCVHLHTKIIQLSPTLTLSTWLLNLPQTNNPHFFSTADTWFPLSLLLCVLVGIEDSLVSGLTGVMEGKAQSICVGFFTETMELEMFLSILYAIVKNVATETVIFGDAKEA